MTAHQREELTKAIAVAREAYGEYSRACERLRIAQSQGNTTGAKDAQGEMEALWPNFTRADLAVYHCIQTS